MEIINEKYGNGKKILFSKVNLYCNEKDIINIIGENGVGKSTFFKFLQKKYTAKKVYIISDYINLPIEVRVKDFIGEFSPNVQGFEYLTQRLQSFEHHKISELSTGERRLLEIYCALIANREVLICDEILNGLDYINRTLILEILNEISEHTNTIIFFTSHLLEDYLVTGGRNIFLLPFSDEFIEHTDTFIDLHELQKTFSEYYARKEK